MPADEQLWEQVSEARRNGALTPAQLDAWNVAEENADDTAAERGFALHTAGWFRIFALTYEGMTA